MAPPTLDHPLEEALAKRICPPPPTPQLAPWTKKLETETEKKKKKKNFKLDTLLSRDILSETNSLMR